jgi:Short C-terminal domain
MIMRRRPLLRAAVVGGGAYVAGKRAAERSAMTSEQDERLATSEHLQAPAAPYEPPPAQPAVTDQLNQLASLHQQGALSDSEFAAAKAKLLG